MENNLSLTCQPEQLQKLVTQLIKEDLRCSKLVLGLSGLGLDAGKYHTELSTLVFNLLDLDTGNDHLMGLYFEWIDRVQQVEDIEEEGRLAGMANEIYERLIEQKGAE